MLILLAGGCSHVRYLDIHTPFTHELFEINRQARERGAKLTLSGSRQVVVDNLRVAPDSTSFTILRERARTATEPGQIPTAEPWTRIESRQETVATELIREIRLTDRGRGSYEGLGLGALTGAVAGLMRNAIRRRERKQTFFGTVEVLREDEINWVPPAGAAGAVVGLIIGGLVGSKDIYRFYGSGIPGGILPPDNTVPDTPVP